MNPVQFLSQHNHLLRYERGRCRRNVILTSFVLFTNFILNSKLSFSYLTRPQYIVFLELYRTLPCICQFDYQFIILNRFTSTSPVLLSASLFSSFILPFLSLNSFVYSMIFTFYQTLRCPTSYYFCRYLIFRTLSSSSV